MAGKDNRKPKELQSAAFFFFFFGISPKIEKPAFSEKHVSLIAEKCQTSKFYLLFPLAKSNLKVLLWDSISAVISHEISLDHLHGQQIFLEHQSSPLPLLLKHLCSSFCFASQSSLLQDYDFIEEIHKKRPFT